jgi:hypothetical protein
VTLFIGGPLDGKTLTVPPRLESYRIMKRQPFRWKPENDPFEIKPLDEIEYRRVQLIGDTEFFTCLTLAEAVKKLLAAYPRNG